MTVLTLSDFFCHLDYVDGVLKYKITDSKGNLIAAMSDGNKARDYTRQLQQDYDRLQFEMHPERYGVKRD